MTASRKVVVSGIGILSPLGLGEVAFLESLRAGRSALPPADEGSFVPLAGFVYTDFVTTRDKRTKKMDLASRYAVAAGRLALDDARLLGTDGKVAPVHGTECAVVSGSAFCTLESIWAFHGEMLAEGPDGVDPKVFPNTSINVACAQVAIEFGLLGPMLNLCSGPSSGLEALGTAAGLIGAGRATRAVAGGFERVFPDLADAHCRLRGVAQSRGEKWDRPFGMGAQALVLGEGACMFVLEEEAAAFARGARVRGRLLGYGSHGVPAGPRGLDESEDAVARALGQAMAMAGTDPGGLDWVLTGAAGPARWDRAVARGLARALGGGRAPAVYPLKALLGDCLGAFGPTAGAVGLLACGTASTWGLPVWAAALGDTGLQIGPGRAEGTGRFAVVDAAPAGTCVAVVLEALPSSDA